LEHFRPKTEAKDINGLSRDGYWWLAFDYRNFRVCGNVGNRKKGGWFPLHSDSLVSTYDNQCEESETPYLLDPTDPVDVELIAFDEEGKAIPAPGATDWEVRRVEETINRLKLNEHDALTQERRKVWQRMSFEIDRYQYFKSRYTTGRNIVAKAKATEHARNIRTMTRETQELSSVAKWCVLFSNDNQLIKLVA
jgi:hypothetical protein